MTVEGTGIGSQVLQELKALAQKYGIQRVVLFGSRARGEYRRVSDIDLAVTGGDADGFAIAVDEETSTLLEFDVVNLDGAVQEDLRKSILEEGKLLYEKI